MREVEIRGARELYVALSTRIPQRMEGPVLQKALTAGAKPIVQQAKANIGSGGQAPANRTGTLRRSIYQMRGKKSTVQMQTRIVNVRKGRRAGKAKGGSRDAYYGRWVEYGHRNAKRGGRLLRETTATTKRGFLRYQERLVMPESHRRRLRGQRTWGTVPEHPFMRPAWEATKDDAQVQVLDRLAELLEAAVRQSRF